MARFRENFKGDIVIWAVVFLLSLFGILAVYSSTSTLAYQKQSGNTEYYIFKHIGLLLLGLLIMWAAHLVDFRYYSRISQILLWLSIPLLCYTLAFGSDINNARRWITLPVIGMSFQTSDLAKLALIMYIARFLSRNQDKVNDFKGTYLPILFWILGICGLIAVANLSTALVLFLTCMVLLFIGRIPFLYLAATGGIAVVGFGLLLVVLMNTPGQGRIHTWKNRVESFVNSKADSDAGSYQNIQGKIAIARGKLMGTGPGKGNQKNFLPSPYADFIFAIIIEEFGSIMGALTLVFLYLLLLYRTVLIVIQSPKAFGALLATGLSFSLIIQAFINMGVAVNIFPVTGLPLPLVSMGGTSLFFTSFALGIILSVSRTVEENRAGDEGKNLPVRNGMEGQLVES